MTDKELEGMYWGLAHAIAFLAISISERQPLFTQSYLSKLESLADKLKSERNPADPVSGMHLVTLEFLIGPLKAAISGGSVPPWRPTVFPGGRTRDE